MAQLFVDLTQDMFVSKSLQQVVRKLISQLLQRQQTHPLRVFLNPNSVCLNAP